ncbi:MAG: hypothetical protein M1830_000358 [Pleopsidium flavum]|nr:MAG: hypothetical protein M1830_000358 [Pleopsidium flavum]
MSSASHNRLSDGEALRTLQALGMQQVVESLDKALDALKTRIKDGFEKSSPLNLDHGTEISTTAWKVICNPILFSLKWIRVLASLLQTYRCLKRFENLSYAADEACIVSVRLHAIECGNLSATLKQRHAALAISRLGDLLEDMELGYTNEVIQNDPSRSTIDTYPQDLTNPNL